MSKTVKNILSLNSVEAMDFFMKSEQYHGFELPEFFTFDEVLKYVRETIGDAPWLQNMTYTQDKKQGTSPYTLRLCQLVVGKAVEPLWNNDWLKAELTTNMPYDSVVDGETLKKVTPVITFKETRLYNDFF